MAASLLLGAFSANAELIKGDWISQGDGKAMLDTFTGKEWLSLTETNGLSVDQVLSDSKYNGWRVATSKEVKTLFEGVAERALASGASFATNDKEEVYSVSGYSDNSWSKQLISYLGVTYTRSQYDGNFFFRYAYGLTSDGFMGTIMDSEHTYSNSGSYREQSLLHVNYNNQYPSDRVIANTGVFLINDGGLTLSSLENEGYNIATRDVPAPTLLAFLPLALLAAGRKKRSAR